VAVELSQNKYIKAVRRQQLRIPAPYHDINMPLVQIHSRTKLSENSRQSSQQSMFVRGFYCTELCTKSKSDHTDANVIPVSKLLLTVMDDIFTLRTKVERLENELGRAQAHVKTCQETIIDTIRNNERLERMIEDISGRYPPIYDSEDEVD
jgi:hypothetical protein